MNRRALLPRLVRGIACVALVALATGCAQLVPQTFALRTGWPEGVTRSTELPAVPFFPQEDYQCGPASLATVLAFSGVPVTPESLVPQVYLPERHGSLQLEMLSTPRRYSRVSYLLAPRYADLLREVAAGNPVVVLQDVGPMFTQWHYAVVNGFDYPSGTIYLRSGTTKRLEMPFTAFEREWMKSHYWAMVVVPPDRIPATATEDGWIQAVLAMSRTGSADAVTSAYEAALKRWPANLPAAIGLSNQYYQQRDYARAITVLRSAEQRYPQSVIVKNNLAQALSDSGRNAEALAVLDRASSAPEAPFSSEVKATRQLILQRIAQQRSGNRR